LSQELKKIRAGARRFRAEAFHQHKELFEELAKGQKPKLLVITCADSRVVPSLITGTKPGDLFVERNPGALVPIYSNQAVGVSASIEYAVKVLHVEGIVVCGHSDCGAMSAALHPEKTDGVPAVGRWLSFARPAVDRLSTKEKAASEARVKVALTKHCIRLQLEHLMTHPSVQEAVKERGIKIVGTYYDIATGKLTRVRVA
jgi:carbonic anhydrase